MRTIVDEDDGTSLIPVWSQFIINSGGIPRLVPNMLA